jgi:hypothetical protein
MEESCPASFGTTNETETTSKVKIMIGTFFLGAESYNQPLVGWNTQHIVRMNGIFGCSPPLEQMYRIVMIHNFSQKEKWGWDL